jgi:hypothetical protein
MGFCSTFTTTSKKGEFMKKNGISLLMVLIVTTLFGCNQSSLLSPGGSESAEEGSLRVEFSHGVENTASLHDLGDAKEITNNVGFVLRLQHAALGIKSLNLISSGDDPECIGGHDTLLNVNGSDDLLGLDETQVSLGSFAIPVTAYCSYELTLGASSVASALKFHTDHDGEDLTGVSSTPAHATLHLEGSWTAADGVLTEDFEIEILEDIVLSAKFRADEDGGLIDHPLHFHGEETSRDVSFRIDYDLLFRDIDFAAQTPEAIRAKIVENLRQAIFQNISED